MNLPDKVKHKLQEVPDEPGCYMMRDRQGRIIYVGKAVSLRKRVQSYFRDATLRKADPKLRGLLKSVHDLEYIVLRNEAEALLTEGRLIKEYKPRYNVDFRDDKRFLLLRAKPTQHYPAFSLCRIQRNDSASYFGPYASSAAARAALDFVEKQFGLRKCAPELPDAETYRHCINDIVRYCSAPCVGRVTKEDYRVRFEEACAFLKGERPKYLKDLRARMEESAAKQDFERAAALRDTYFLLLAAVKQRARSLPTPEMKKEAGLAGILELKNHLGLTSEPHMIEGYDISNISGTYAVAGLVCSIDGVPQKNRYRRFRIRSVEGSDDPRMIAEAVRRRFSRLVAEGGEMPDLVLVDGGITQLRAAREEIRKLGLDIPAAGLAKQFEELYWKEDEPPLRLGAGSKALPVLQRLRDEAHRFAQAYHLKLRNRLIRDSMLDEVPGVGPSKKKVLLNHFGSVRKLKLATEDDIAKVPGIGYQLARLIVERLTE